MKLHRFYYLLFIAFAVNVPGVMAFDQTGLTHNEGLFNLQSASRIVLAALVGIAFFACVCVGKRVRIAQAFTRRSTVVFGIMYVLFLASCFLNASGIAVALFRIFEWLLLLLIIEAWSQRIALEERPYAVTRAFFVICAVSFAMVAVGLIVAPKLALTSLSNEEAGFEFRLGGSVIHPNRLGVLAGIALWYFILFKRRLTRVFGLVLCLTVLMLTYSRTAIAGLMLTGPVFAIFGSVRQRMRALAACALAIALAIACEDQIWHFLQRGQGAENIETASDRMAVWVAGLAMLRERPLVGFGYITGVKEQLAHTVTASWWIPPHVHNELLQTAVTAGIFAAVLVLIMYFQIGKRIVALPKSPVRTFLLTAFVQLLAYAIQGPILSYEMSSLGAMLLAMYFFVPPKAKLEARMKARTRSYAETGVAA
jgi:O-antigen ligase